MKHLVKMINPILPRKFIYCDVGARWGVGEPWNLFSDLLEFICFEPDKDEYQSLMNQLPKNTSIHQCALHNKKGKTHLYLTKSRGCTSTLKPNKQFLKNYPNSERFDVENIIKVDTTTLDILHSDEALLNLDFIKIDIQGAELDVLKGGKKVLSNNLAGIEVEVEFQQLYEKQPLFSDVDSYIRKSLGLEIQDIRKTYWKHPDGINIGSSKGQLIFGDALYFRPPNNIIQWGKKFKKEEASNKIIMACLMGLIYGYLDYSLCILNQPSITSIVEKSIIESWKSLIVHYGKCIKYNRFGAKKLSFIFNQLYRICQPTYQQWGSNGHHLGSRKDYMVFH